MTDGNDSVRREKLKIQGTEGITKGEKSFKC